MIKELYYKYKIFLIPTIVGITCMSILILVIYPQSLGYFQQMDKINTLKNNIEVLNNKASELQKIDEEARKKDLVVALTVLPVERDVPIAMSTLQNLIAKSNLVLKSTAYTPISKSSGKDGFMFRVSVIGPLFSVKNFLNELQNGSRIFKVESISLNFQDTSSLIVADIPLTIFYEPAPKTVITLDQIIPTISDQEEELIGKLSKSIVSTEVVSTSSAVPLGKSNPFE